MGITTTKPYHLLNHPAPERPGFPTFTPKVNHQPVSSYVPELTFLMTNRLPTRQKWLMSLQLLLLYLPVALYINVPASARTWEGLIQVIPLLSIITFSTFCVYFVWISAIDFIQQRLTERFGDNFLL